MASSAATGGRLARPGAAPGTAPTTTAFGILTVLSICHLLNDLLQSLLPAIYPILKSGFRLDFGQRRSRLGSGLLAWFRRVGGVRCARSGRSSPGDFERRGGGGRCRSEPGIGALREPMMGRLPAVS